MEFRESICPVRIASPRARTYGTAMSAWPGAHAGFGVDGAAPNGSPAGTDSLRLRPIPAHDYFSTLRAVWAASAIHADAFGIRRWRSRLAIAAAVQMRHEGSAICSLTPVVRRSLIPILVVILVALMAVPSVAISLGDAAELGLVGRVVWLVSTNALAVAAIVVVTNLVILACRWGRTSGATFEVSNFANGAPSNGDARALLTRLVAEADVGAHHLVLRVAVTNDRALALYRRHGFSETSESSGYIRMERGPRRAGINSRQVRPLLLVAVVVYSGLVIAAMEPRAPLLIAALAAALVALGVAAAIDHCTMRIPNMLLFIAAMFGAVATDATNAGLAPVAGAGVAAAPLALIHLLDPRALGFGDVKFAATSGLIVGALAWPAATLVPLLGLISVAIVRVAGRRQPRAFGQYLMAATLVALATAATLSTSGAIP